MMVVIKHEDKEGQAPSCSVCSVDADLSTAPPSPGWRSGTHFFLNLPAPFSLALTPYLQPLLEMGLENIWKTRTGLPWPAKGSHRVCLASKL